MKSIQVIIACFALFAISAAQAQEQTTTDGRPPIICRNGALVSGLLCEGSYCDDITMRCDRNIREVRRHFWTRFVHRPGTGGLALCATRFGPTKGFMSGIACEGDWCDNIALQCTELELFEPDWDTCVTSDWFSEEEGQQTWPSPFHFPVSVECEYSNHCDRKKVRSCRLKRR
ncbi:MAG: hypothetical protein K8F25_16575 [Fimbriimonadaceae bacterium]|nr:hypothetical protein [Alphaproteobacteria bacterium]